MNLKTLKTKIRQKVRTSLAHIARTFESRKMNRIPLAAGVAAPSVTIVFLPYEGKINESINATAYAELRFDPDTAAKEINDSLMNIETDYIVFAGTAVSVGNELIQRMAEEYAIDKNAGIAGVGSYYDERSSGDRMYLIKQEGIVPELIKENDDTPVYRIEERRHLCITRKKKYAVDSIPSTDLLMIPAALFKETGGLCDCYENDSWACALADLCLKAESLGRVNHLCTKALVPVTGKKERKQSDPDIYAFTGRWYRYLQDKQKGFEPVTELSDMEIDIAGPMPGNKNMSFWGDYHYSVALKKALEKQGYKVNILTRDKWYERSTANNVIVLRGLFPYYRSAVNDNRKIIYWIIYWIKSTPDIITPEELNGTDHVFYSSKKLMKYFESMVNVKGDILPQCTDPEVMKRSGQASLSPELLYVGNNHKTYRKIMKDLLPTTHELKVYGRFWKKHPEVAPYVVADYMDNNVVADAYHNAAILLNDHCDEMREFGIVSNRIFDALCAEAFIISDDVEEIHEMFGDAVVTYTDREDLIEKIDYYLAHPEERNRIAGKGQRTVLENHTFDHRADEIIKVLKTL